MADPAAPGSGGSPSAPGAVPPSDPAGPPQIGVNAQYVKDLSFENPRAPYVFSTKDQPQVQVNVDVGAQPLGPDMYEVSVLVNATAKTGQETAFVVELTYAGLFTVKGVPPEHLGPVLLVECPRLLFPFARQIIADATRDGGFPPLLVAPIDFAQLYMRSRQAQASGPSSPVPGAGGFGGPGPGQTH